MLKILLKIEQIMRTIAAISLVGMAALTCCDVVGRAFGTPIFGTEELVCFLAVICVGFSLPFAHKQKSHIGVEIFVDKLPKPVQERLRFCTNLTTLLLFGIVSWRMVEYALSMRKSGELSMNLEFPEYVIVFMLSLGFIIFTLHLLADTAAFFKKES